MHSKTSAVNFMNTLQLLPMKMAEKKKKNENKNQGVINHHKDKHDGEREVKYYENLILLHQGPKHRWTRRSHHDLTAFSQREAVLWIWWDQ